MDLTDTPFRALVTGADEHQGLAVIRGLGLGGIEVVAAGAGARCIGHRSRFATHCARYASPATEPEKFVDDVIEIARRTRPAVIVPSVETTLVLLNNARSRVEEIAPLAAPDSATLEFALDKGKTIELARRVGVPAPRTVTGTTVAQLLDRAAALRFPVAIKPRGHYLHPSTANTVPFKSTYAGSLAELAAIVAPIANDAGAILVQEFARGVGRCVAAVCRYGEPLELFAYARLREYPLSGGVSVLRRSIPLDAQMREFSTLLLSATRWHGVAMVELKYDAGADTYSLMEINGRFQASTALSLRAGVNLPLVAASLFAGWTLPPPARSKPGVTERWLRGDLLALRGALTAREQPASRAKATRRAVLKRFLGDFREGVHLDEYWSADPAPAFAEARNLASLLATWCFDACKAVVRALVPSRLRSSATTPRRVGSGTPVPTRLR